MIKFKILAASVTPSENGEQNFAFRHEDFPNTIWGVENMIWDEKEGAVTANISVFREQMEDGQIVANQIVNDDPEYDSLMTTAEEVINSMIEIAIEEALKTGENK